jgi:hypothetical protein
LHLFKENQFKFNFKIQSIRLVITGLNSVNLNGGVKNMISEPTYLQFTMIISFLFDTSSALQVSTDSFDNAIKQALLSCDNIFTSVALNEAIYITTTTTTTRTTTTTTARCSLSNKVNNTDVFTGLKFYQFYQFYQLSFSIILLLKPFKPMIQIY